MSNATPSVALTDGSTATLVSVMAGQLMSTVSPSVLLARRVDDSFVDEYAYITQSYYADHFFQGDFHHRDWLDFFAMDLQPLPKYLIGFALRAAHLPMPGPALAPTFGV